MSSATEGVRTHYAFLLAWPIESLGGVNGVVQNLLREFQSAGDMAPMAIEVSGRDENASPLPAGQPWPHICCGPISSWNSGSPWKSLLASCVRAPRTLLRLHAICRRYSIAVLNPHFIGMEYFPLMLLRRIGLFRGRLIFSFHGSDIREMMQSRGVERRLFRILLAGADQLVACSDGLREEILAFAPDCGPRTVAIHNGIDEAAFRAQAPEPFPLPGSFRNRTVLVNVGAFEYKKGHDILLRAFALLRVRHPGAALVIAGQRSAARIRELASGLGVEQDLLLFENIPHAQIVALLLRADVFVFSSRWEKGVCGEGFAMALLEAGAVAKPVVTTLSCGTTELIEDGVTGRIVPTENPEALAEAISDVVSDPESGREMANRLRERIVREFTWKHAYRKYLCLARGEPM
jgi:glycosyltransferase involved in cell wall biosynthesis